MASHHYDALWEKLHELEAQLAAYKLMRAAREEEDALGCGDAAETTAGNGACRGRQYEAYMRRRDARRVAAASSPEQQQQQQQGAKAQQPRATRRRPMPLSPRALRCAPRDDTHEAGAVAGTPRLAIALAKRAPPALLSIPTTPRKDTATTTLARSRTVSSGGGGVAGSPARSHSYHQRRSSLGALAEFGECATPRPFLKRGTGTGGAARLRSTRVHDVPAIDVPSSTPRPAPPLLQEVPRHARSVSELPAFDTAVLASPQAQGRVRKRWGSPERPAAMFSSTTSAGESHGRDLSKGLKKLLSFVRKGGKGGGGEQASFPAASPRGSGKPVTSKGGWSGCSLVDVPFDRASLEAHRFPMTPRAVGISG